MLRQVCESPGNTEDLVDCGKRDQKEQLGLACVSLLLIQSRWFCTSHWPLPIVGVAAGLTLLEPEPPGVGQGKELLGEKVAKGVSS
jgi:hypothetical protein